MSERIKLLLVEDDEIDQLAFKRLVHAEGLPYDYTIAGSVKEALKALDSERFDIVLLDLQLGDGTAFEVFPLITDTPFIVITGSGDVGLAVKAMKSGAYDFLIKGHEYAYLAMLPVTVSGAIKKYKTEKELEKSLQEIKVLRGILPICAYCKKIRNDTGVWQQMETYIRDHSEAEFSHGMCPDCSIKAHEEIEEFRKGRNG